MKIYTTSEARKNFSHILNVVIYKNAVIGIGRRNKTEAMVIKFPQNINVDLSEETNINANSESFSFLEDEKDIYTLNDLKKRYV